MFYGQTRCCSLSLVHNEQNVKESDTRGDAMNYKSSSHKKSQETKNNAKGIPLGETKNPKSEIRNLQFIN